MLDGEDAIPRRAHQAPVEDLEVLLDVLDVADRGGDRFIGRHPRRVGSRTFGGLLVAQGIRSAWHTVDGDRPLHALHSHFIRGGDVDRDLEYRVDRLRDGREFANRQITATQDGEVVFVMIAAFQRHRDGLTHGTGDEPAEVAAPEDLAPIGAHLAGYEDKLQLFVDALRPIDYRYANDPAWKARENGTRLPHNRVWMRADGALPDDPAVHAAVLGYASDTTVLDSVLTTHGLSWGLDRVVAATLNHSMWFHRPLRFDEWTLYATRSPAAAGSRGLATGRFLDAEGTILATVAQEGVFRHFPR